MNSSKENSNPGRRYPSPVTSRELSAACAILLFFLISGCHSAGHGSSEVTLTLIDQAWVEKEYQLRLNAQLVEFTKRTGIRVEVLPPPEEAMEQVVTWRRLLESGARVPDVYRIDVIWPGILADNLLDLKPYIPEEEIKLQFPELVSNDTVKGRLLALPSSLNEGALFYRVDLLKQYGYHKPPKA